MPAFASRRRQATGTRCAGRLPPRLLHFDGRALVLELLLELGSLVLGHAFLHGLAAGLDEVLGFLEAEAR